MPQFKLQRKISEYVAPATGSAATDTVTLQTAINAAENGHGNVYLPPGEYVVTDSSSAWAIAGRSGVTLNGDGIGRTIIRLADGSGPWARVISATGVTDFAIRNLTIDGNASGNTPLTEHGNEQQHGVFLDNCIRPVIENVRIHHTRGDGIYWYNQTVGARALGCFFDNIYRVGIHAQWQRDGVIAGCDFADSVGNNHVKSEIDDEGQDSDGLIVSANTFHGNGGALGVTIGGRSDTTPYRNVVIQGNTFRGLRTAIPQGVHVHGLVIADNLIDQCGSGITTVSYNTAFGYINRRNYQITGNLIRVVGPDAESAAIHISNTQNAVIAGNLIECLSGVARGIWVTHCERVSMTGNTGSIAGNNATVIRSHRSRHVRMESNLFDYQGTTSTGSRAISLSDGGGFSGGLHVIADNSFTGNQYTFAVDYNDFTTDAQIILEKLFVASATAVENGSSSRKRSWTIA